MSAKKFCAPLRKTLTFKDADSKEREREKEGGKRVFIVTVVF